MAHGEVLIIDGDDYIGRPTDHVPRLCDAAQPGELLATARRAASLPPWIRVHRTRHLTLPGLGRVRRGAAAWPRADVAFPNWFRLLVRHRQPRT